MQTSYNVLQEAKERQINVYVNPKVAERYKKVDKRGKSIGDGLENIDVMRVIRWIGVETSVAVEGRKKKTTVPGFHSLRHSFASFCAEAGVPKAVVISSLGANSSIVDEFYTHVGEDAQRAAIDMIAGSVDSTPSAKIKKELKIKKTFSCLHNFVFYVLFNFLRISVINRRRTIFLKKI